MGADDDGKHASGADLTDRLLEVLDRDSKKSKSALVSFQMQFASDFHVVGISRDETDSKTARETRRWE
jgi:hypothetical protein